MLIETKNRGYKKWNAKSVGTKLKSWQQKVSVGLVIKETLQAGRKALVRGVNKKKRYTQKGCVFHAMFGFKDMGQLLQGPGLKKENIYAFNATVTPYTQKGFARFATEKFIEKRQGMEFAKSAELKGN